MVNYLYLFLSIAFFHLTTQPMFPYNEEHLEYALSERRNLQWLDLSGADLSNQDFTLCDLSNTDLSGANLSGTDFSYAHFFKTKLCNTNLQGTNFYGAHLESINLSVTNWEYALNLKYSKTKRVLIGRYSSLNFNSMHHPNYGSSDIEEQANSKEFVHQSKKCTTPPTIVYYETSCPLCSKNYAADEEIVALPCGHTMCHRDPETNEEGCIFKLIATYGKKCPVCRQLFSLYSCVHIPSTVNLSSTSQKT